MKYFVIIQSEVDGAKIHDNIRAAVLSAEEYLESGEYGDDDIEIWEVSAIRKYQKPVPSDLTKNWPIVQQ